MATSIEHYRRAEQILADRHDLAHTFGSYEAVFALAQVHAMLALAAVTALGVGYSDADSVTLADWNAWNRVAGVEHAAGSDGAA